MTLFFKCKNCLDETNSLEDHEEHIKQCLKNCPFCKKQPECMSHAELFLRTNPDVPLKYAIFCDCQLFFETADEAIDVWNERHDR